MVHRQALAVSRPFALAERTVAIHEIQHVKVSPRLRADYPVVDVTVALRVSITARMRHRGSDLGVRTVAVDVRVGATGTGRSSYRNAAA